MTLTYQFDEFLNYSDHERRKWKEWIAADPSRLDLAFQPGGRFPTVASLLDHIFLVERRHLSRLEGGTPPDSSGVAPGDWEALFEYGALVRDDLRRYVADVDDTIGAETITFSLASGVFTMTRRKLAAHIFLHETRHLAQLSHSARLAGLEPPGAHDLFYFTDFE
jgi:uncharacterized damage-inducible protein DinB